MQIRRRWWLLVLLLGRGMGLWIILSTPVQSQVLVGGGVGASGGSSGAAALLCAGTGGDTNNSATGAGTDYVHSLTCTIPANTLLAQTAVQVCVAWRLTTGNPPPTMLSKLKIGATTLAAPLQTFTPTAARTNYSNIECWNVGAAADPGPAVNVYTAPHTIAGAMVSGNSSNSVAQPLALATNTPLTLSVTTNWNAVGTGTSTVTQDRFWAQVLPLAPVATPGSGLQQAVSVTTSGPVIAVNEYVTTAASTITRTLPAAASGQAIREFWMVKVDDGPGTLTLAPAGSNTLNGLNAPLSTATPWTGFHIKEVSPTGWYVESIVRLLNLSSDVTGMLLGSNGGTGLNTTGLTGVPALSGGTWSITPVTPAVTGTRYLCITTTGQLVSSATACSGT